MSFFEIFQPSQRHGQQQRDLDKVLVVEDSQGRGPWGRDARIDLDGGSALLFRAPEAPETPEEESADERDPAPTDS